MSDQISQDVLNSLAAERGVSQAELDALSLALAGKSIDEIAQTFGITSIAVRKRLGEVYRKFNIEGKGPGKLEALKRVLESKHQAISKPVATHQDWGNAPDVSIFYGRQKELAELEQWILNDNCRLVALLGMAGIGKTALAAKLAKKIQSSFDYIYWRSLLYPPSIEDFVDEMIKFLSENKDIELAENINNKVNLVMDYLRKQRCLLIIDNVETILRSDTRLGRYKSEYQDYGLLLRRMGEEQHQSCLLLCSQGKPKEIAVLESSSGYVRLKQIEGLEIEDIQHILKDKGLTNLTESEKLIRNYQGNPLEIQRISILIKNLFNGDLKEFTEYSLNTLVLTNTLIDRFDQIFSIITPEEIEIMQCLAMQEKPISIIDLQKELTNKFSMNDLIKSLESLEWRLLIENNKNHNSSKTLFYLDLIVKKYTLKYYKK